MKILYVNNAPLCSGCENHMIDVAVWLRDHGAAPSFLVREGGLLEERVAELGMPTYPVFAPGRTVGLVPRIVRALLAEQPDVISINREHNILPVQIATYLARPLLRNRPRLVAVFHAPTGRWYPGLGAFDGIIGTSDFTAQTFVKANPQIKDLVEVIYCGIEIPDLDPEKKFRKDRPRRFFNDRVFPIIGMVGDLWKNQEELVALAPQLISRHPDLTIAIIGGYDGSEALRAKITAAGLDSHFVMTGRIPRESIPDMFFDLDLSVSTHRNEGFGIVHVESLAAGTPVVAYKSGGLVEIVEKGGGVLVEGLSREFVAVVADLLDDDERRWRLGAEGRRVAEDYFSMDVMGRRHLAFYRRILDSRR